MLSAATLQVPLVHEVVGERACLGVEHEPPVLPALDHVRELVELSLEGRRDDIDSLLGIGRGGAAPLPPLLADRHCMLNLEFTSLLLLLGRLPNLLS